MIRNALTPHILNLDFANEPYAHYTLTEDVFLKRCYMHGRSGNMYFVFTFSKTIRKAVGESDPIYLALGYQF